MDLNSQVIKKSLYSIYFIILFDFLFVKNENVFSFKGEKGPRFEKNEVQNPL